jgi:hypothetical protein
VLLLSKLSKIFQLFNCPHFKRAAKVAAFICLTKFFFLKNLKKMFDLLLKELRFL